MGMNGNSSKPARDEALDFTKGALVVLMVIYHWCNYFISTEGFGYRYIRFITPSFIFITGFLVSNIYLTRYDPRDVRLPMRLVVRGIKLLLLFVALNLAASLVVKRNYDGSELGMGAFFRDVIPTFVTGNGSNAVFQVLVPIAYVLLLCAGLLLVRRVVMFPFYCVCGVLSLVVLVVDSVLFQSGNLQLLGAGCLGVLVGGNMWPRVQAMRMDGRILVLGYAAYLAAVTIWNVPYALQLVGVCANLWVLYLWGGRGLCRCLPSVLLLGQYTLLAYIVQIGLLQLLAKVLHPWMGSGVTVVLGLVAALALTQLTVYAVEVTRRRVHAADVAYRMVFA
jgi:peptidoglycan/LPS O-acetylase OafA/YrhL